MSIKDNRLRINCWQGTKTDFGRLHGNYIRGWLYFVMDGQTAQSSEVGVIYLAIGAHQCIRFGSFSKETDIDEKIQTIIEEKTEIHVHEWYGDFPDKGEAANLYISREAGSVHRWDPDEGKYKVIGGYEAGNGIEIKDGVISVTTEGEDNGFVEQVKGYVDNELEQFAETVPHLRYMTDGEVDAIFEEVFDEPYITETR